MAVEAPTNCWTLAEQAIATAVANSAAFQWVTETANAADAGKFVFGEQKDEPLDGETYDKSELENQLAYAQVYSTNEGPYGKQRSATNRFEPFGSIVIFVERLVREADQNITDAPEQTHRWFKNRMGDLVDEVIAYIDNNGGPFIRTVAVTDGPGLNSRDRWQQQGMWQGIEWSIDWGLVAR